MVDSLNPIIVSRGNDTLAKPTKMSCMILTCKRPSEQFLWNLLGHVLKQWRVIKVFVIGQKSIEQVCVRETSGDGLRVCLDEMGWHEEASHLYYSAGWLLEPEQAVRMSLHRSSRGDKLRGEHQ